MITRRYESTLKRLAQLTIEELAQAQLVVAQIAEENISQKSKAKKTLAELPANVKTVVQEIYNIESSYETKSKSPEDLFQERLDGIPENAELVKIDVAKKGLALEKILLPISDIAPVIEFFNGAVRERRHIFSNRDKDAQIDVLEKQLADEKQKIDVQCNLLEIKAAHKANIEKFNSITASLKHFLKNENDESKISSQYTAEDTVESLTAKLMPLIKKGNDDTVVREIVTQMIDFQPTLNASAAPLAEHRRKIKEVEDPIRNKIRELTNTDATQEEAAFKTSLLQIKYMSLFLSAETYWSHLAEIIESDLKNNNVLNNYLTDDGLDPAGKPCSGLRALGEVLLQEMKHQEDSRHEAYEKFSPVNHVPSQPPAVHNALQKLSDSTKVALMKYAIMDGLNDILSNPLETPANKFKQANTYLTEGDCKRQDILQLHRDRDRPGMLFLKVLASIGLTLIGRYKKAKELLYQTEGGKFLATAGVFKKIEKSNNHRANKEENGAKPKGSIQR